VCFGIRGQQVANHRGASPPFCSLPPYRTHFARRELSMNFIGPDLTELFEELHHRWRAPLAGIDAARRPSSAILDHPVWRPRLPRSPTTGVSISAKISRR